MHVHLVGCTGVPSAAYAPLLRRLLPHCTTSFSEIYDCAGDWNRAAAKLARLELPQETVGFGHSIGGALMLQSKRFSRLLLWDPPMFAPWSRAALATLRATRLIELMPMLQKWRKRPIFSSRAECEAYVRSRDYYQQWHPEIIEAFVEGGISDQGWVFSPRDEVQFLLDTPARAYNDASGHYWYSTEHRIVSRHDIFYLKRVLSFRFEPVPFSHFHPLHDPDDVARRILEQLETMS